MKHLRLFDKRIMRNDIGHLMEKFPDVDKNRILRKYVSTLLETYHGSSPGIKSSATKGLYYILSKKSVIEELENERKPHKEAEKPDMPQEALPMKKKKFARAVAAFFSKHFNFPKKYDSPESALA